MSATIYRAVRGGPDLSRRAGWTVAWRCLPEVAVLMAVGTILVASVGVCCGGSCIEPGIRIDSVNASPTVACVGAPFLFTASAHDDDVRQPPNYPTCTLDPDTVQYSWLNEETLETGTGSSFTTSWPTSGVKRVKVQVEDGGTPIDDSLATGYVYAYVVEVTMVDPVAGTKFHFDDSDPDGICSISCTATIYPVNFYTEAWANDNVSWSISPGVSGSSGLWISATNGSGSNKGLKVTLQYTGLPSDNDSFGDQTVSVSCGCWDDDSETQVFYTADAANHPGPEISQNWYYYYKKTCANGGTTSYDSSFYLETGGWAGYVDGRWQAFITSNGHHRIWRSTWSNPEYIDRFAWDSRHEVKHVLLLSAMWGPTTNRNDLEDQDDWMLGDFLRDADEPTYHRGYDPHNTTTYDDEVDYGEDPIPDAEDDCMRTTTLPYFVDLLWTNGSADDLDWANPGKQY